jgi:Flp pilus assembly protein TadD
VLQTSERPTPEFEAMLGLLASLSYRAGDMSGGHGLYRELTGLRARSADHYNLGLIYSKLGRTAEAEQAFLTAIRIQGDYAKPYASLSRIYREHDRGKAIEFSVIAALLEASRVRAGRQ